MTLECNNLYASYKSNKNKISQDFVLNDISISLNTGEFVCLAGPNGSGKSSLLSILSGLEGKTKNNLKITSAKKKPTIIKDDKQELLVQNLKRKECAKYISYMMQSEKSAWNVSVLDTILTGRYATSGAVYTQDDLNIAKEAAELLKISHLLDRGIFNISGGEVQKVRIARSIAQNTPFILLDEPCSGLDISFEVELLKKLKELSYYKKIGILISIHDINNAARFADKIILLPKGEKNITGTVKDVFTKENINRTYKADFNIFNHPVFNILQAYQI